MALRSDDLIASNRFGLGPRRTVSTGGDPRGWLMDQVSRRPPPVPAITALSGTAALFDQVQTRAKLRAEQKRNNGQMADGEAAKDLRNALRGAYAAAVGARVSAALTGPAPFHEHLVHFWANHFAVSADNLKVLALAGPFENEAIRPHVTGSFADLLLAAIGHPAMLLYLNNERSAGPGAPLVSRTNDRRSRSGNNRRLGLNENLAREILELHTLGVRSGYGQSDVTELAKAITGWSVGGAREQDPGEKGTFHFYAALHEPGSRTVLGRRYAAGGLEQGQAILGDLARHPATARHVAGKLARHFLGDAPRQAAVDALAKAFQDSGGQLPAVYAALLDQPEAWTQQPVKLRTPWEWAIASLRLIDAPAPQPPAMVALMAMLGQPVWMPGAPAGWPDTAAHWLGPDMIMKRIEAAQQIAGRVGERLDPAGLAGEQLAGLVSPATRQAIARCESREQGLALLLASPDLMRR